MLTLLHLFKCWANWDQDKSRSRFVNCEPCEGREGPHAQRRLLGGSLSHPKKMIFLSGHTYAEFPNVEKSISASSAILG